MMGMYIHGKKKCFFYDDEMTCEVAEQKQNWIKSFCRQNLSFREGKEYRIPMFRSGGGRTKSGRRLERNVLTRLQ